MTMATIAALQKALLQMINRFDLCVVISRCIQKDFFIQYNAFLPLSAKPLPEYSFLSSQKSCTGIRWHYFYLAG